MIVQCTVCGEIDIYQEPWTRYTSYAIDESYPRAAIYCCCPDCLKVAKEKIDKGNWDLPEIIINNCYAEIVRDHKGYKIQKDQLFLKRRYERFKGINKKDNVIRFKPE